MTQVSWNVCFRNVCDGQKLNNWLRNCVPIFTDKSVRLCYSVIIFSALCIVGGRHTAVAGIYVGWG